MEGQELGAVVNTEAKAPPSLALCPWVACISQGCGAQGPGMGPWCFTHRRHRGWGPACRPAGRPGGPQLSPEVLVWVSSALQQLIPAHSWDRSRPTDACLPC